MTTNPDIMRADPAYIARIVGLAREVAAAGHGGKAALYAAAAAELSVSVATVKRDAGSVIGRQRKVRRDAGRSKVSEAELDAIAGYMMGGYRANKKRIISVAQAVEVLKANGAVRCEAVNTETGEIRPVSISTVSRAMKSSALHPKQMRRARPAARMKSKHPNHVWQIDASISTLFYVPDGGLEDMPPGEFYKNKPGNFERIKRLRLTRYCVTDHYSGWIFVFYVPGGESVENMAESLIRCMVKRSDRQMHGAPLMLMTDPGSAPKSGAVGNLCRRLGIEIIINQAGNARAKGQVEKAHDIVEKVFESGFKFTHVPDLDWINAQAARWCAWFNATQNHSRHGASRHAKWMEITAGQLRVIDEATARAMLTARPEPRLVNDHLEVRFDGRRFSVRDVPNVLIGESLSIAMNPFDRSVAWVVETAPDGNENLIGIPEVMVDGAGFADTAAVIGEGYKAAPDTLAQTNLKRIQRLMYGVDTDREADAAERKKSPVFGGRIDPYKMFDDLPQAIPLPRRGTALDASGFRIQEAGDKTLTHFEASLALAARGIEMDGEKNRRVAGWYPAGVPEDEIDSLCARLAAAPALRAAGG
jgi:transposase InsO family protein